MDIMGNKVILRGMEGQDNEMLLNLIKDLEVAKLTGGYSSPTSYEHQMNWFRSLPDSSTNVRRIIADREKPEIGLGIIILSNVDLKDKTAEIYIKIMKSVRNKGYGWDAVNAMVSYAFCELHLTHIYSNILEYNIASRRLFEKCGFKQESIHKSKVYKDGYYPNLYSYEIRNNGVDSTI